MSKPPIKDLEKGSLEVEGVGTERSNASLKCLIYSLFTLLLYMSQNPASLQIPFKDVCVCVSLKVALVLRRNRQGVTCCPSVLSGTMRALRFSDPQTQCRGAVCSVAEGKQGGWRETRVSVSSILF